MDDLDDGLLGIAISDDEKVDDSGADTTAPGRNGSSDAAAPAATARADRNALSEEDYQVVKKEYRARMENGEIWKTVKLPFGETVSKPATQELVHAVEELYFFKRYEEAAALVHRVFSEGNGDVLDRESKKLLRDYETRCLGKLATT